MSLFVRILVKPDGRDDRLILSTLGAAQYRVGRFADALKTLTRSEALNRTKLKGSQPADLALAMVHCHLGHKDQGRLFLDRLRKTVQMPQ